MTSNEAMHLKPNDPVVFTAGPWDIMGHVVGNNGKILVIQWDGGFGGGPLEYRIMNPEDLMGINKRNK